MTANESRESNISEFSTCQKDTPYFPGLANFTRKTNSEAIRSSGAVLYHQINMIPTPSACGVAAQSFRFFGGENPILPTNILILKSPDQTKSCLPTTLTD